MTASWDVVGNPLGGAGVGEDLQFQRAAGADDCPDHPDLPPADPRN